MSLRNVDLGIADVGGEVGDGIGIGTTIEVVGAGTARHRIIARVPIELVSCPSLTVKVITAVPVLPLTAVMVREAPPLLAHRRLPWS